MKRLVQRFADETKSVDENFLLTLQVISWEESSEILYCDKGVIIFLQNNERELMYQDLCKLLKKVS